MKADLFHSLFHFGFNESPHQCNPGSLLLVESGILGFGFWYLTLGFRNSAPRIRNPAVIKIRNPSSTDKESGIQYVESRIHSVESRIKDFLGLPYMGRNEQNIHHETRTALHMRLTELTLSQFILLYGITVY